MNPDACDSHLKSARRLADVRNWNGIYFWIEQIIQLQDRQKVLQLKQNTTNYHYPMCAFHNHNNGAIEVNILD